MQLLNTVFGDVTVVYSFQARAVDTLGRTRDWSPVTSYSLLLEPEDVFGAVFLAQGYQSGSLSA